jgi:hypothetical protein
MNQFKSAWQFAFTHWQFLAVLAFPVFLVEIITAYYLTDATLLLEAGNMDDIGLYFETNSMPITLLSFISIVLSISFTGGVFVAFDALTEGKDIKPFDALFIGFKKFFPLLGALMLCYLIFLLGFLMLILPGFYLAGRLGLTPAYVMFEGTGVRGSIAKSWEVTDEHGTILFFLTFTFFALSSALAMIVISVLPMAAGGGSSILQLILAGIIEYTFVFPWAYIYFSLYTSLKSSASNAVK